MSRFYILRYKIDKNNLKLNTKIVIKDNRQDYQI